MPLESSAVGPIQLFFLLRGATPCLRLVLAVADAPYAGPGPPTHLPARKQVLCSYLSHELPKSRVYLETLAWKSLGICLVITTIVGNILKVDRVQDLVYAVLFILSRTSQESPRQEALRSAQELRFSFCPALTDSSIPRLVWM